MSPRPSAGAKGSLSKGFTSAKSSTTRKKLEIVRSTPTTYGMNSRFFVRFVKTAAEEKKERSNAQNTNDPRCPAHRPATL